MAEIETNQDYSQGIKLFGKTITLHDKREKDEDKRNDDPTAEKKPEKIITCPRCKSMETKFCYFNNYNVNQPRHFCKGCQRYWTAGGALRNVPIGAGRRKAKPTSQNTVGGFPGSYLHDPAVQQFQLDGLVEDWKVIISHSSFRQALPVKRRRDGREGQTC